MIKFLNNNTIQKRLNVVQSGFGHDVSFSMRTFRFVTGGSAAVGQEQRMHCDLHLEPIASVATEQPDNCTCHTEVECAAPGNNHI